MYRLRENNVGKFVLLLLAYMKLHLACTASPCEILNVMPCGQSPQFSVTSEVVTGRPLRLFIFFLKLCIGIYRDCFPAEVCLAAYCHCFLSLLRCVLQPTATVSCPFWGVPCSLLPLFPVPAEVCIAAYCHCFLSLLRCALQPTATVSCPCWGVPCSPSRLLNRR